MAFGNWLSKYVGKDRRRSDRGRFGGAVPPRAFGARNVMLWALPKVEGGRRKQDDANKPMLAESLGMHGSPREGIDLLHATCATQPSPLALMTKGWLSFLQNSMKDATALSAAALDQIGDGDTRRLAAFRCAWIHVGNWQTDVADRALATLRSTKPDGPWLWCTRIVEARIRAAYGRSADAANILTSMTEEITGSRESALAYYHATAANECGMLGEALRQCRATLGRKLVPPTARALLWLQAAKSFSLLAQTEAAAACYEHVLTEWPGIGLPQGVTAPANKSLDEAALLQLMELDSLKS